jgi:UDP-glucose 4-epimerase
LRRQVIWDICQKVIDSKRLVLQGTGRESRDFIHATDIAKAVEIVARNGQMQGEVYNLANGREVRIDELATLIINELNLESQLQFDGIVPEGVPLNWVADISKIRSLGFNPQITLESGIKAFSTWCRLELL